MRTGMYELTTEQMERTAPSIFSGSPALEVSEKYKHLNTYNLLTIFMDLGWKPVSVEQVRSRKTDGRPFAKHLVRMKKQEGSGWLQVRDGLFPEVVITNSHNRTSAIKIDAGIFRMVCSNGMIVADSAFESIRVKHVGFDPNEITNASYRIIDSTEKITNRIDEFSSLELSGPEQIAFGRAAGCLKYDEDCQFSPESVIRPRRFDDNKNDLFTIYNRAQENLIRGGNLVKRDHRARRDRGITNIDKNVKLNKALWSLTEEMATIKQGNN